MVTTKRPPLFPERIDGAKRTDPTRRLFDPDKEVQLPYVNRVNTDIRVTFDRVRAGLAAQAQPKVVSQLRRKAT